MKTALGPNASVPCRVTEMGPRPWQDLDKRYPRLTPAEHARQVGLICRWLEGETDIGGYRRPEWLKAGYFWIMGAKVMGDYSGIFEADAFYADWFMERREPQYNWPQAEIGHMPAIETIKALARETPDVPDMPDVPSKPDEPQQPPQGSDRSQVLAHLNAAHEALGKARDLLRQVT